jgi:hypothetical protein
VCFSMVSECLVKTTYSQPNLSCETTLLRSAIKKFETMIIIDDSSYRRNFDLDKKSGIHYHSWKEHLKMSKIAKFDCEML